MLGLAGNADRFTAQVPQLQAQTDEVVRAMSASGSPSSQIYIALREVLLAATMAAASPKSAPVAPAPRWPATRSAATQACSRRCWPACARATRR